MVNPQPADPACPPARSDRDSPPAGHTSFGTAWTSYATGSRTGCSPHPPRNPTPAPGALGPAARLHDPALPSSKPALTPGPGSTQKPRPTGEAALALRPPGVRRQPLHALGLPSSGRQPPLKAGPGASQAYPTALMVSPPRRRTRAALLGGPLEHMSQVTRGECAVGKHETPATKGHFSKVGKCT